MNDIRKLNLTDLIFYVAKQWKRILACSLILGVLMGGIEGLKFIRNDKQKIEESFVESRNRVENAAELEKSDESEKEILEKISNYSESDQKIYKRQEEVLNKNKRYYEMYRDYYKNSIKMQLNPDSLFEGEMQCLISGKTKKDVLLVEKKCNEAIKTPEFYNHVKKELQIETKDAYIDEIISNAFEMYEDETGLMTYKVIHFDEEACKSILETIQDEIHQVKVKGASCETLDYLVTNTSKISLTQEQENIHELKWSYYDRWQQVEADREALEAKYQDTPAQEESQDDEQSEVVNTEYHFQPFKIIMALIAGVILSILYYAMKYLFSDYIHTEEDINGIKEVAVDMITNENKVEKNIIDRWIYKFEKKLGNVPSTSLEMVILPIAMAVKQRNISDICMTGTVLQANGNCELVEKIKDIFAKYDVNLHVLESILEDVDSMQSAVKLSHVVIYEVCEKTSHKKMCEEISRLKQCGITIEGVILEK